MILSSLSNAAVSLASASLIAQEAIPDPAQLVERYGFAGALGLLLWWVLQRLSKQLDENTRAIAEASVANVAVIEKMAAQISTQYAQVAEALRQKP